jgi:hypothetical protein
MTQIDIPSELPNILRNFTLSVLRSKPRDIIDHAVDYFTDLQQQKQPNEKQPQSNDPLINVSSSTFSSPNQSQPEELQISNPHVALSGL